MVWEPFPNLTLKNRSEYSEYGTLRGYFAFDSLIRNRDAFDTLCLFSGNASFFSGFLLSRVLIFYRR